MASSSGSGSSANHTQIVPILRQNRLHLCDCINTLKRSMERISWSDKNPARRFRNYVDSLVEKAREKCKFFEWIDDKLTPHYKDAMNNLKHELQEMKDWSLPRRLQRKVAELERVVADLKHEVVIERVKTDTVKEELAMTAASLKAVKKKFKLFVIGVMGIGVWVIIKKLF